MPEDPRFIEVPINQSDSLALTYLIVFFDCRPSGLVGNLHTC